MSGQNRRGVVGTGYMPKGGAAAAQRHNARVEAAAAQTRAASATEPSTADTRTGGRASDRATGWWTSRPGVLAVWFVATGGLTCGFEALIHALGR